MNTEMEDKRNHKAGDYFNVTEALTYFFRKKDPNRPTNFNIRVMHGINKISILIFLVGIIYLIIKNIF